MKILITGSEGFVGKNIYYRLKQEGFDDIVCYDINTPETVLNLATKNCDFVLHFAGVNRPNDVSEFQTGNYGFTTKLLDKLKANANKVPILITSSIQASLDNPYGKSKKAAEDYIFEYAKENLVDVYVYRLVNVFGKWCKPNYNSAVATFCYNIARDLPITINDENIQMNLVYIDDIADEIIRALKNQATKSTSMEGFYQVPITHSIKLGEIVELLQGFRKSRQSLDIANVAQNSISSKLYSTYLSYLPEEDFAYPLNMIKDERGFFSEILHTLNSGQVSVSLTKKGVVRGNHWHHSKNEKFLVVKGKGAIRFRKVGEDKLIEYIVSGDKLEVVDIPTGYTHQLENLGDDDLITLIWANEVFNPNKADTYFEKV